MQSVTGLTIKLLSFTVPQSVLRGTDLLRVKARTLPEENKQKYDLKGKQMGQCNLSFTFNITNQTEKVLFILRKKTILSGNKTVGTAEIPISELTKPTASESSNIITLDIYYPLERQLHEQLPRGADRANIKEKVIGQMKIAVSLSEPLN
ncbi:hypothetical protein M9Y10_040026 [Tritrichomonas musculus]|uniref:Uncharacterized protein n=1 Tax=Tritrichomonas musculus TaxID=1915356 RepID=A0ABR2GQ50_9EUKA